MSELIEQTKEPQELIDEVLGRYSVLDLVEQTDEDLARGEELYERSTTPIEVLETGEINLIKFWKIRSGKSLYEVRRFENFCWCSCLDFYFSRKVCKHTIPTTKTLCSDCGSRDVDPLGSQCTKCMLGGELEPGDHFTIACKSYKKTSVFRVEEASIDGIRCVDIAEPDSSSCPRSNYHFRHFQVDSLREQKKLKMLPPEYGRGEASQLKAA